MKYIHSISMKIIKTKLFKLLVCVFCIGFLIGIISFFFVGSSDKSILKEGIISFVQNISSNNINYLNSIFTNISNNLEILFIIWISGFLCFPAAIIPFLILYKSIKLSFDLIAVIYSFKVKGIFLSLFYLLSDAILMFLFIFMSYYAIFQAIRCFKVLKQNKSINLISFFKNYVLIFLILSIVTITISIINVYFISFITKFVV